MDASWKVKLEAEGKFNTNLAVFWRGPRALHMQQTSKWNAIKTQVIAGKQARLEAEEHRAHGLLNSNSQVQHKPFCPLERTSSAADAANKQ